MSKSKKIKADQKLADTLNKASAAADSLGASSLGKDMRAYATSLAPGSSRLMSWADFTAGVWTKNYTSTPCSEGQRAAANAFPAWQTGTPPTWAELCAAALKDKSGDGWGWARWLIARTLLVDRALLIEWTRVTTFIRLDAYERDAIDQPDRRSFVPAEADEAHAIRSELMRWCAGETVDLRALRDDAWELWRDAYAAAAAAAAAAAYAAAYAAAASAAADADAAAAADADAAADAAAAYADAYADAADDADAREIARCAILDAVLPLLDRAMEICTSKTVSP